MNSARCPAGAPVPAASASEIDLSLGRIERLLARPRIARREAAAGHPCRRHQRQGLDHRLHARHARGGGQARACLYLAPSRALPRTHPARRKGGGQLVGDGELFAALEPLRSGQRRRADHVLRDHDGGGLHDLQREIRPIICCSKSASAAAATRPTSSPAPAATRDHADLDRSYRSFLGRRSPRSPMRRREFSSAACRPSSARSTTDAR